MNKDLPFNLKVIPGGWGNPLMEQAFVDFLRWAIAFDPLVNDYKNDTGSDLYKIVPRTPI